MLEQNDEKRVRQSAKSTVISQGNARIISYADIVEMQRRRTAKADAKKAKLPGRRQAKAGSRVSVQEPGAQVFKYPVAPCPGRAPVAKMW